MPIPRVRLVVLNYNGGDLVVRCIEHLERLDWPQDRLEIVVVDNASADGSDVALARRPRVRLIRSERNAGFPANNLAMRDLDRVDYVGLVNNDAFAEPDYLKPLVAALADDPALGAACPKILLAPRFVDLKLGVPTHRVPGDDRDLGLKLSGLEVGGADRTKDAGFAEGWYPPEPGGDGRWYRWSGAEALVRVPVDDGTATARLRLASGRPVVAWFEAGADKLPVDVDEQPRWTEVPLAGPRYDVVNNVGSVLVGGGWGGDRGFLEPDIGQYDEPQDVFAWCGAGVLFPVPYLQDVGLFDDRFFMYYEDTDMAWRGRARGWRYRYVPDAVLRHVHAATSVEGSPLFHHFVERNRLVMLTKNAPSRMAAGAAARFLVSTASYARRDVVRPLLHGRRPSPSLVRARLRSFGGFVRLLPEVLPDRRRLRAAQRVHDEAITGWAVDR
ncbi:MAG TPA: glycosyltransferase family 2 protein [Nocardioidaceae bacterium]|nr:glycosyltransferase family 2 protein [Nocardioidaceae bacterium]